MEKETRVRAQTMLAEEHRLLDGILVAQQQVRQAVRDKNWENLENTLYSMDSFADNFAATEIEREGLFARLSDEDKREMKGELDALRHKLEASRIENEALNKYLKVTSSFLDGILDSIIPSRRNRLYSRSGALVEKPEHHVVLDTVM
jgi:hypothetical protein